MVRHQSVWGPVLVIRKVASCAAIRVQRACSASAAGTAKAQPRRSRPRGSGRKDRYLVRSSKVLPLVGAAAGAPIPMPSTSPPEKTGGPPPRPASPRDQPPPASRTAHAAAAPSTAPGRTSPRASATSAAGVGLAPRIIYPASSSSVNITTPSPPPLYLLVSPDTGHRAAGASSGCGLRPSSSTVETAQGGSGRSAASEAGPADVEVDWRTSGRAVSVGEALGVTTSLVTPGTTAAAAAAAAQTPARFFHFVYDGGGGDGTTGGAEPLTPGAVPAATLRAPPLRAVPSTIPEALGESRGSCSTSGDSGGVAIAAVSAGAPHPRGSFGRAHLASPLRLSDPAPGQGALPLPHEGRGSAESLAHRQQGHEEGQAPSAFRTSRGRGPHTRAGPTAARSLALEHLGGGGSPPSPGGEDLLLVGLGKAANGGYEPSGVNRHFGALGLGPGLPPRSAIPASSPLRQGGGIAGAHIPQPDAGLNRPSTPATGTAAQSPAATPGLPLAGGKWEL